jgi:hypothetical protein
MAFIRSRHSEIPARGWKDILLRVFGNISKHRILALAAGMTYYSILAVFPAIGVRLGVCAIALIHGRRCHIRCCRLRLHLRCPGYTSGSRAGETFFCVLAGGRRCFSFSRWPWPSSIATDRAARRQSGAGAARSRLFVARCIGHFLLVRGQLRQAQRDLRVARSYHRRNDMA